MIRFQEIKQNEVPWDLLLLAQPSLENIQTDLKQGLCHVAKIDSEIVGVFVIVQKSERLWEITNIAVAPKYQGQKIGKAILRHWHCSNRIRSYLDERGWDVYCYGRYGRR